MRISGISRVLLLIIVTVIIGTIGFRMVGGNRWSLLDSLYMAVITLSTVGFTEVHPLGAAGKLWTIILITLGIGIVAYAVGQTTQYILNLERFRRKKMAKRLSSLKKHFIVCGYGRMGKVICEELEKQNLPFAVVEVDPEKIALIQDRGYLVVEGDATLDRTLQEARIETAAGLVVVLSSDSDILFVTMAARTLNPEIFIMSRCSVDESAQKLLRAGASKVVNPYVAGGHKMSELLVAPYVEDSVEISTPRRKIDLLVEEIKVENTEGVAGVPIRESRIREDYHLLITGIIDEKGEMIFSPDPDTRLKEGYTLMLMGEKENLHTFKEKVCRMATGS
ncbi:MAG: potassium channel family protein [Fidelibacterota bacterium]